MFPNVSLQKGIISAYFQGWDQAETQWIISPQIPSTARQEPTAFLGSLPRMRKQRGERIPPKAERLRLYVVNEEFEASIEVQGQT